MDRRFLALAVAVLVVASTSAVAAGSGQASPPDSTAATATDAGDATDVDDGASTAGTAPAGNNTTVTNASRTAAGVVVVDRNGTVLLRALVGLNCTTLRVNATPETWPYVLRLVFVHEETGRRRTMAAGPLNGTTVDPFGRTPYVLVRVDLRVLGRSVLTRTRPAWCPGPTTRGALAGRHQRT